MRGNSLNFKSGIRSILILAIIVILQSPIASASNKRKKAEAKALFKTAYDASRIKAKGSPPFHLKAEFQFYNSKFKLMKGSYDELWMSPDQHKSVFSVPWGSDIIMASGGQRWRKSTLPYQIIVETIVNEVTDLGLGLQYGPPHRIKKIHEEKIEKRRMMCVVPKSKYFEDEYCFDPHNGRLLWRTELMCGVQYRFSDYEAWGSKWVPRKVVVTQDHTTVVRLAITSLAAPGPLSPATFTPPKGAEVSKYVTCRTDQLKGAKLIKRVMPIPPEGATSSGYVSFYANIGKDGRLRGLNLIHPVSPLVDAAALHALRQWRFTPPTCKGVPRGFVIRLTLGL